MILEPKKKKIYIYICIFELREIPTKNDGRGDRVDLIICILENKFGEVLVVKEKEPQISVFTSPFIPLVFCCHPCPPKKIHQNVIIINFNSDLGGCHIYTQSNFCGVSIIC